MLQIKKQMANILEYKVGNNANIANFVRLCKTLNERLYNISRILNTFGFFTN